MYVSEREGSDATGDGTQKKPFKTVLKVPGKRLLLVLTSVTCAGGEAIGLVFLNVNFTPFLAPLTRRIRSRVSARSL